MIKKDLLIEMYLTKGLSMKEIANKLQCSPNRVVYWMAQHDIKRRSISEAIYQQHNPLGDPFKLKKITSIKDAQLMGLGIGLYWGEGNKKNRHSVRLGNTDPELIRIFVQFLVELCGVDPKRLRYSLQIFSDIDPQQALAFWMTELHTEQSQFGKVVVTPARSLGTYRVKSIYGVLTVHFHNYKLRDIIVSMCRDSSVGR
ncbi:MAG: hypothetical protein ACHQTE_02075, partial [Candidatus Saccharimonadales bacterium]